MTRVFLTVMLMMFCLQAQAASRSTVDRNPLREGEIVVLVVETDQDADPDIEPLRRDFELRGSTQSRQIRFVNGQRSMVIRWTWELLPKKTGKLTIPSLTVGKDHTNTIDLKVLKAGDSSSLSEERDLFIETSVDKNKSWVREQVVLTVAFFQSTDILEGSLSKPTPADTVVEQIGDGIVSEEIRNGIRYRVTRVRYALFPQASGTLTIDPVIFNGKVVVDDKTQSRGVGGFSPFNSLIAKSRRVRLRSRPLQVEVQPQPAAAEGQSWWLPVTGLKLEQEWTPEPPVFKVGEPVTRTIRMQAIGAVDSLLPELPLQGPPGLKLYPDQPVSETRPGGKTMIATREYKVAMIPASAGELELPEIRVSWWNLNRKRMETATLPARTVKVIGPPPQPVRETPVQQPASADADVQPQAEAAAETAPSSAMTWIPAALMMVLWLLTLVLWWLDRRRLRRPATTAPDRAHRARSIKKLTDSFNAACAKNDAHAAAKVLVELADTAVGPVHNLGQLRRHLDSDEAREALGELQQVLYGREREPWDGKSCQQALSAELARLARVSAESGRADPMDSVPALYSV